MKIEIHGFTFCTTMIVLFGSCGNDDGPDPLAGCSNRPWSEQIQAEADAVTAAGVTFANDANQTTCDNFRAAYIDYLDALDELTPCVPAANRADFDRALDTGREELTNLDCNQDWQS